MMKYIAIDIDGCITNGKGKTVSPLLLSTLYNLNKQGDFTSLLCTGRSAPYVEAIAQVTGLTHKAVCENGAYLYHPLSDEVNYHPFITDSTLRALDNFNQLLRQKKYQPIYKLELGKNVCISLNPVGMSIKELFEILGEIVDQDILYINHSTTAVDITPRGVDKAAGIRFLAQQEEFNLKDVLSIGDSSGDLSFMQISGQKACPVNACNSVKEISDYISPYPTIEGVIDIIKHYTKQ